jgi:hypothetical protein
MEDDDEITVTARETVVVVTDMVAVIDTRAGKDPNLLDDRNQDQKTRATK